MFLPWFESTPPSKLNNGETSLSTATSVAFTKCYTETTTLLSLTWSLSHFIDYIFTSFKIIEPNSVTIIIIIIILIIIIYYFLTEYRLNQCLGGGMKDGDWGGSLANYNAVYEET